jgi:alcohol dehydrogenase
VTDEKGVFVEPLAAACQILEQIDLRKYPSAAVLGDGKLAQLIAMVLRATGSRVVLYGKYASKLALARRMGVATKKVRGDASDLTRVKETYRLVVEATGSPTGLALAQRMTEPRGTLLLKSTFHGAAPVETWPLLVKELTGVGSQYLMSKKATPSSRPKAWPLPKPSLYFVPARWMPLRSLAVPSR